MFNVDFPALGGFFGMVMPKSTLEKSLLAAVGLLAILLFGPVSQAAVSLGTIVTKVELLAVSNTQQAEQIIIMREMLAELKTTTINNVSEISRLRDGN